MITAKEVEEIHHRIEDIFKYGEKEWTEISRIEYAIANALRNNSTETEQLYLNDEAIQFVADHGFTVRKAWQWTEKNSVYRIIIRK